MKILTISKRRNINYNYLFVDKKSKYKRLYIKNKDYMYINTYNKILSNKYDYIHQADELLQLVTVIKSNHNSNILNLKTQTELLDINLFYIGSSYNLRKWNYIENYYINSFDNLGNSYIIDILGNIIHVYHPPQIL